MQQISLVQLDVWSVAMHEQGNILLNEEIKYKKTP